MGVVAAETVRVSTVWDGRLHSWHVADGDLVQAGQLLATFVNPAWEHEQLQLQTDLKLAEAELEAAVAELQRQEQSDDAQHEQARSEFYRLWGELLSEEVMLEMLESKLARLEKLHHNGHASNTEWETTYVEVASRREKIAKMGLAVAELKKRAELTQLDEQQASVRIKPKVTRVDVIRQRLDHLQQTMACAEVVSPVNGRVTRRTVLAGECAPALQTLAEIVVTDSTEIILFFPQDRLANLSVGQSLTYRVGTLNLRQSGTIVRMETQLRSPPPAMQRFYPPNTELLAVHLAAPRDPQWKELPIGTRLTQIASWGGWSFNNLYEQFVNQGT